MKKYKIVISGRGAECYVHSINEEQLKEFISSEVESGDCEPETISEILNKEDIFETDNIFLGPYNNPEDFLIQVFNDNNIKIWESDQKFEFQETENEYLFETDNSLLIEDYTKGEFYNYEIEVDGEFDENKLKPVITEIAEVVEIITGFYYGDVDLNNYKDYGDYWSKGITYYLN
jgi:hypothetical protein